jgi:hypothetical protein
VKREPRKAEPTPIGDLLPGVLRGMKGPAKGPLARTRTAWAQVVGPAVAARTRIAAVESGEIRVEVASAALKHDLQTFRRGEVLEGLKRHLPDLGIRRVSYRVGAVS